MRTLISLAFSAVLSAVLCGACLALPLLTEAPIRAGEPPPRGPAAPASKEQDAVLRKAWRKLPAEERSEVAEWFAAEARALGTFQNQLLRFVMSSLDRDPYDWPEADDHGPLYDSREHTPAQVIRRRPLSPRSKRAKNWAEKVFAPAKRRLISAWTYDYGTRSVQRLAPRVDPNRIFENALAGFPPDLDLAEALIERALDDGDQQKLLAGFAHAYADREGRAYPGVTLYDAWGSGLEIEMPDVECLGLVHDILDDWSTWTAPVPGKRQDALYAKIRDLFVQARNYRGLRSAFARTYLSGEPVLEAGYGPALDRLHGLWETFGSDPATLAGDLPGPAERNIWLARMGAEVEGDTARWQAGQARKATLVADRALVRAALERVMRESGALGD